MKLDLHVEKSQSALEEVLIFTVTSSNAGGRTCYGESSAKRSRLIEFGETVAEFVVFIWAGKKQQTRFQPKQDSGICGAAAEEMDTEGFRSLSTSAERTQGLGQK